MQATHKLIKNIGQLITLEPLAREHRKRFIKPSDLGIKKNAWLLLSREGHVEQVGEGPDPLLPSGTEVFDVKGALILPGFVDSHTHLIWAGSRALEMERRLNGETYQQIAASGDGIAATVRATRAASSEELLRLAEKRAARLLRLGVTTLEVKSGYGLSVAEELRHLRLIKSLKNLIPQTISPTCLALHGLSPEHPTKASWVAQCIQDLLPIVASEGLSDGVDAFIEEGYFSVEEVEPYVKTASALGLKLRIHADEFSNAGAALAAARWGAASADHLQCADPRAPEALAKAGVTATLLPGTSLFTKLPFTQGRSFADAGVPVAIASDFNPGSCMLDSLPMLAAVASVHAGLKSHEVLAGITLVPAMGLGLGARKGALTNGYDGDFVLYQEMSSVADWLYDFGRTTPDQVWCQGQRRI